MKSIKLLVLTQVVTVSLCLLLLIWDVIGASCDPDVVKVFETILLLSVIYFTNSYSKISES